MSDTPHITKQRTGSTWNGWCVNYSGFMDRLMEKTHCDAGVEYESVKKPIEFTYSYGKDFHKYKSNAAYPCFKDEHGLTNGCNKCRFPSSDEIKAHDEETTGHITKMLKARAAIIAEIKDKRGVSGVMDCPCCDGGKLSYSRASCNGHVHARCSTKDCVAWME